jgi:hypothetical protein
MSVFPGADRYLEVTLGGLTAGGFIQLVTYNDKAAVSAACKAATAS